MTSLSRAGRAAAATLAVGLALTTAACGGGGSTKQPSSTPATTASTPAAVSSSPAPARPAVNPLTGGKVSKNGVVAVKIDDTGNGRPQRNIDKADVVYIEEVEGGLTRLLAVFNSSLPTVEAVRSTRAADPEILAQYGPIAYVASGGSKNPLSVLDNSPLKTSIGDRGGPGISRDSSRYAPYNETANLATVAKALKAPRAKSVGFSWSSSTASLAGTPSVTRIRTVVGGTQVEFRYEAKTHRYYRYIDGTLQKTAAGTPISTTNVIVQFCRVVPYYKDRDVLGNPNAFTYTVGKGSVAVFRDGHRVSGTWTRAKAANPTTFRTTSGKAIPLRPGNVWVVLTKNGNKVT